MVVLLMITDPNPVDNYANEWEVSWYSYILGDHVGSTALPHMVKKIIKFLIIEVT